MTDAAGEAAQLWFDDPGPEPFGDGHIHDTYLLEVEGKDFVLQRINEYVFVDSELVMRQVQSLLEHVRDRLAFAVPVLVESKREAVFERTDAGVWRVWQRLPGMTLKRARNSQQAFAAGQAFARLQVASGDLQPKLRPTIEHFLKLGHYLDDFSDKAQAASDSQRRFVDKYRFLADHLQEENAHIHGDCKVDNLLFADTPDQADVVGMLDFDTAMYGNRAWDFGDLVRSISTSAGGADMRLIAATYRGFVAGSVALGVDEAVLAPSYVTFMLGLRFLTDHLTGDPYFKVTEHGENLLRAEQQFDLLTELQELEPALRQVLEALVET